MYLYHSKYTIFSSFGPKKTNIEDISDKKKNTEKATKERDSASAQYSRTWLFKGA